MDWKSHSHFLVFGIAGLGSGLFCNWLVDNGPQVGGGWVEIPWVLQYGAGIVFGIILAMAWLTYEWSFAGWRRVSAFVVGSSIGYYLAVLVFLNESIYAVLPPGTRYVFAGSVGALCLAIGLLSWSSAHPLDWVIIVGTGALMALVVAIKTGDDLDVFTLFPVWQTGVALAISYVLRKYFLSSSASTAPR